MKSISNNLLCSAYMRPHNHFYYVDIEFTHSLPFRNRCTGRTERNEELWQKELENVGRRGHTILTAP